jgi:hypothetical protein
MLIILGGSAAMTVYGLDFVSAIGATTATIGNIGPAIGSVGPVDNYCTHTRWAANGCSAFYASGKAGDFYGAAAAFAFLLEKIKACRAFSGRCKPYTCNLSRPSDQDVDDLQQALIHGFVQFHGFCSGARG